MGRIKRQWHMIYRSLARWIVPGLRNAQYVYKETLRAYARPHCRWLDAGCGRGVLPEWMRNREREVVHPTHVIIGMDTNLPALLDNNSVTWRVVGDLENAPFRPESFDLVSANTVVEHLQDPESALAEVRRMLRPHGVFIFHTPNLLNYQTVLAAILPRGIKRWLIRHLEGREDTDIFPTHYRLNTAGRIQTLSRRVGFKVRELLLVSSSAETINLGPLVFFELVGIWILNRHLFRHWRSNIIAVLERIPNSAPGGSPPAP